MSVSSRKLMGATAGAEFLAVEDVFQSWLYTGNGTSQTITNGIDLAGEGGLWWGKQRNSTGRHWLLDNARGGNIISTNLADAQLSAFASSPFTSTGISFTSSNSIYNASGSTYASWTFRQAPRFFDVVTYTGTGANRTIAHDLGVVPGCIIVKRTDTTGDWQVYHRSNTAAPETDYLVLNSTAATVDDNTRWNDTLPTSTVFSLGTAATVNASGGTYVAYLFAHDPLGPSEDGSDGLIACGGYTGTGSNLDVSIGFEPQWVLIRKATGSGDSWYIYDTMRGIPTGGNDSYLLAESAGAEAASGDLEVTSTGIRVTASFNTNYPGTTYIYIAIRRGPMREPTVGTEVFSPNAIGAVSVGTPVTTNFPVDLQIATWRGGTGSHYFVDRLRGVSSTTTEGARSLESNSTAAETSVSTFTRMWGNTGYQVDTSWSNSVSIFHNFRRAPGFFDVVAYTGTGANRTISHNLGAVPELMIVKKRSAADNWVVYAGDATDYLILNSTAATADLNTMWNDTSPTSSVFSLGTNDDVNGSTATFIAYLFASLPGISKVGSYTGNGSSQTINCAFTTGARFVLIKRTDSTGDWYVWDTARGIVTGNDPHLSLNTTAAEVTTDDTIDPDSTGFIVNQVAATNVNVNAASYIFLAIA